MEHQQSLKQIKTIIHCADIHIRLLQRHDEYKYVFSKFYSDLKKFDSTTSILVIAGDLFHVKNTLTPESVDIAVNFLETCANILPVIIIPGNHDFMISNRNRLDTISPIIEALHNDNIVYLKESGYYIYRNLVFNHFSAFDEFTPENFVKYDDIPSNVINSADHIIALCHCGIDGAINSMGIQLSNKNITLELFDKHDIAILGDIHKPQILQLHSKNKRKPKVIYSGSLIQQNYGETLLEHGYIVWDLENNYDTSFISLENKYGYFTVNILDNKVITNISNEQLPENIRLRIVHKNTEQYVIQDFLSDFKNKYNVIETSIINSDSDSMTETEKSNVLIKNIFDINYQKELIIKFLKSKNINDNVLNKIITLNEKCWSNLDIKEDECYGIIWKPIKFEFSNMFSYAENNVIDFTKLSGIIGLFARNAEGKSSIWEAITYCIFDKFSKGYKAIDVLNNRSTHFSCKFTFEINDERYVIEKNGKLTSSKNVVQNMSFYKIKDDTIIPLNGEMKQKTSAIVKYYLGNYDDFILTTLSVQNSKYGTFVDLGQSDRKELLSQFLGLKIFNELYDIAKSDSVYKHCLFTLNEYDLDKLVQDRDLQVEYIENVNRNIHEIENEINIKKKEIDNLNIQLIDLKSKYIPLDNIETCIINIDNNTNQKNIIIDKIKSLKCELDEKLDNISEIKNSILVKKDKIKKELNQRGFDENHDISEIKQKYHELNESKQLKLNEIDKFKVIVLNKLNKIKCLDHYEYDENCEYCKNNIFVKDAFQAKEELKTDKITSKKLLSEYNTLNSQINDLKYIDDIIAIKESIEKLEVVLLQSEKDYFSDKEKIDKFNKELETINSNIQKYVDYKKTIESNNDITLKSNDVQKQLNLLNVDLNNLNNSLIQLHSKKSYAISQKEKYEEKIKDYNESDDIINVYNLYLSCVDKNGIPFNIIKDSIKYIENIANDVLRQIVEFKIKLSVISSNISVKIIYDEYSDNGWGLESCSGMEKFISSLAIRIALISISNLPRANILCIDEGFGCIDNTHLAMIGNLFNYLRAKFDFVWIISHLEQMKDLVDMQIDIHKENGYSILKPNNC